MRNERDETVSEEAGWEVKEAENWLLLSSISSRIGSSNTRKSRHGNAELAKYAKDPLQWEITIV